MSDDDLPLREGRKTTAEDDAILDAVSLIGPASEDQGVPGHDVARAAARRIQAVRLRMSGATYDQIAEQAGYNDRSAARMAVVRSLARVESESVTELRLLENARLDADEMVLRTIIADAQKPTRDRISAIDSRLRLSARRSRLNGLDAPVQVALSAGVAADLDDALSEAAAVIGEVIGITDELREG